MWQVCTLVSRGLVLTRAHVDVCGCFFFFSRSLLFCLTGLCRAAGEPASGPERVPENF